MSITTEECGETENVIDFLIFLFWRCPLKLVAFAADCLCHMYY